MVHELIYIPVEIVNYNFTNRFGYLPTDLHTGLDGLLTDRHIGLAGLPTKLHTGLNSLLAYLKTGLDGFLTDLHTGLNGLLANLKTN